MIFQLTNYCDMECPHCCVNSTKDGGHSSLKTLIQVVKVVKQFKPKTLIIGGGEPTDHIEFFKFFKYILKNIKKSDIVLATNGKFLYDNKKVKEMIRLNKKYYFTIQVTAVDRLYKNVYKTTELFNSVKHHLPTSYIVPQLQVVDKLGRAKGKDWSHISTFKRKAPNCFNILSCSYSNITHTFRDIIHAIHIKNQCKPYIDFTGTIYIGESTECVHIGTIWDTDEVLYRNIINREPCGKCGIPYKDLISSIKSQYKN